MAAKVGHKGKVALGAVKSLGFGTWSYAGIDADLLEDTEFGDEFKTYIISLRDGGTVTFDGYYDPTDSTGQTALRSYWSNGTGINSLRLYVDSAKYWGCFAMDEQCNSIGGWSDADRNLNGGTGAASTQESNPLGGGLETFKFTATTAGTGTYARRFRNFGNIFVGETRIDLKLYCGTLGTLAAGDYFELIIHLRNSVGFRARFATDGLYIYDGTSDNEVGVNIVSTGSWQTWRFDIFHDSPSNAACDVYLGGILQSSGVDCSWTSGAVDTFGFEEEDRFGFDGDEFGEETDFTAGYVQLTQYADTTNAVVSYVDYLRAQVGSVNITNHEVSGDKSGLMTATFTGKVTGRLAALQ